MRNLQHLIFTLLLSLFAVVFVFCDKNTTPSEETLEQSVSLDRSTVSLQVGEKVLLKAIFEEGVVPQRSYRWQSSDEEVVSVESKDVHTALLTAKKEGTAIVRYRSEDGQLTVSCTIEVSGVSDGVIRILAIGNSFSDDAVEHYLHGLAKASDIPVVIGNLYIAGASLSRHVQTISEGKAEHSYRKIDVNGTKTVTENTSIATALADERWDYVSFQQASPNSGQYNTYITPLPLLYNYVSRQLNRPTVKYILHQTWAYAQNSTHTGFANYGNNQLTMYNAIINAVSQAIHLVDIDIVVPAGTAIQNGRTSVVGDNFCRDGHHLDINIGRYTAAATWYEAISGRNVIGNPFKPVALSDFEAEIAQQAAHFAVLKPNEITEMTEYQSWPQTGEPSDDIFINFSTSSSAPGWNGVTSQLSSFLLADLKDKNGNSTGISIKVVQ